MFEHACGYKHVYGALVDGRGGVVALSELRHVLSSAVQDEPPAFQEGDPMPRDLAVKFIVGTFLTVLTWLLEQKAKLSRQRYSDV